MTQTSSVPPANDDDGRCEIDRAFHRPLRPSPGEREDADRVGAPPSEDSCEIDKPIRTRRQRPSPTGIAAQYKPVSTRRQRPSPPAMAASKYPEYANLKNMLSFERKYREFVSTSDSDVASALFDELYHDQAVHMMDGVAMNKTSLKSFIGELLKSVDTKRTVKKFNVLDDSHVEVVIHTNTGYMELDSRSVLSLKGGKIFRVEKIESAFPVGKIVAGKAA